jgi:hypothetical protein
VKIVDRQDHDTDYSYVVPAHAHANANANVNCSGDGSNVNCNGSSNTYATSTPAEEVPFHVRGATFSLLLPDGRFASISALHFPQNSWPAAFIQTFNLQN